MVDPVSWMYAPGLKRQENRQQLLRCLHEARNKLAPIVDNVILSTFHLMKRGDKDWFRKYPLTPKECQDIVWASQLIQECEITKKDIKHDLPNVNVIVNNVSLENSKVAVRNKPVVIDEATMLELLDLYRNMGAVIQKMITETAIVETDPKPTSLERMISDMKTTNSSRHISIRGSDETDRNSSKRSTPSMRNHEPDDETNEDATNPPRKKSTLSALLDVSSEDLQKDPGTTSVTTDDERKHDATRKDTEGERTDDDCCASPSIFIKIKCQTDTSDADPDKAPEEMVIHCAKSCTSHQHIRLGGDGVTLKMNQDNVEKGTVYCIDTGGKSSENEIRIIIKQCPECKSTIINSSTKIVDVFGDSHESITLHGLQGDETKMAFSSDEDSMRLKEHEKCACLQKGRVCTDLSKIRCEELNSPCTCDELEQALCDHCEPKMDVWIDSESVDKSTIKAHEEDEEEAPRTRSTVSELRAPSVKFDPGIPLTRRRVCSSMEFDVSSAHTRLRSQEIDHHNPQIAIELKRLGVDNLLRACRPARCCRKAILNERQRTALPYCVSLRSLPLISTDIQVIEQSIDMSVKKIKNATDLTQAQKDKFAYYVSLGRDDFKPDNNFPWVIPVYDMKVEPDRLLELKTIGVPKQVGAVKKLLNLVKPERKEIECRKRYFILKKPMSGTVVRPRKSNFLQKLWTRSSASNDGYLKMFKYCEKKSVYSRKSVWRNVSDVLFSQERKQIDFNRMGVTFTEATMFRRQEDFTVLRPHKRPKVSFEKNSPIYKHRAASKENEIKREASKKRKPLEGGDYSLSSLSNMLDTCFKKLKARKLDVSKKESETDLSKRKSFEPSYTKNAASEIFYASEAVTVLLKRTRSLGSSENTMHISKITKIEEKWERISPEESPKAKKKLEYYVRLINGDLVWGNKLPLEPQKYDTYYNHSNIGPPQDQPNAVDTTEESQRNADSEDVPRAEEHTNPPTGSEESSDSQKALPEDQQSRRSTISEIKPEHFAELQTAQRNNFSSKIPVPVSTKSKLGKTPSSTISEIKPEDFADIQEAGAQTQAQYPPLSELPPGFPTELRGPEILDGSWAPLAPSDTSLPPIEEEVVERQVQEPVEAVPVKETKETGACSRNKCPKGNIVIAIKQRKGKKVETAAITACHKSVCEIYKNKNLTSEKEKSGHSRSSGRDQHLTITANDNIEIYINNRKICLGSPNGKKPKKEDKKEKNS